MYRFLRFLKSTADNLQIFYEARIAPFLAVHCGWIFWPMYRLFAIYNICFIVNIGGVTGHVILELDNFFRKLKTGEAPANKRYVWLRKSTPISKACTEAYKHKFWFGLSNNFIYNILFPLIIRYKDITLDCGLSWIKWQLPDDLKYHKTRYGQAFWYLHRKPKIHGYTLMENYNKLRLKTRDYFPLLDTAYAYPDNRLLDLLGGVTVKVVLIHIKAERVNATAEPTDPDTYVPSLRYLSGLGYRLVFVGREKMPVEFSDIEIINYANSDVAEFRHDIQLFKIASIVITAGSGICWLADCFDKYYLYLNSWHLLFLPFSEKCINVPALIRKDSGEYLSFSEQIELYNSVAETERPEGFFERYYKARNATAEEILSGLKELLDIKNKSSAPSRLQSRFREMAKGYPYYYALSSVSDYFLENHRDLF